MIKQTRFRSADELKVTLRHYAHTYNHRIPQRALNHLSPVQALKKWQSERPELFVKRVYNQTGHDTYTLHLAIGVVLRGAQDNTAYDGIHRIVGAGELAAVPPGEAHAGRLVGETACEYAMVYVRDALLLPEAADLGSVCLNLSMNARSDVRMVRGLTAFMQVAVRSDAPALSVQGEWSAVIEGLVKRYGDTRSNASKPAAERVGLRRAHSFLKAHWSQPVTLAQLAPSGGHVGKLFLPAVLGHLRPVSAWLPGGNSHQPAPRTFSRLAHPSPTWPRPPALRTRVISGGI